jgi:D-threo-aldose 1-dehydrogenase
MFRAAMAQFRRNAVFEGAVFERGSVRKDVVFRTTRCKEAVLGTMHGSRDGRERKSVMAHVEGTTMARRPLGRTGFEVTPICLGTSALGSMPRLYGYAVEEERALQTIRAMFASGVNFLDTSNGYAEGESERRIGVVLAELGGPPEGVLIATKVDPDASGDFSGRRVRRSVEESQHRLGMPHLPLVYLHDPERIGFEASMQAGGPVEALVELREQGVIGHLGVAGGPVGLLERFVHTGAFEVVLSHNRFTLLDRSALPLMRTCEGADVAFVNGAPFGGGMLAKGPAAQPNYCYRPAPEAVLERARSIEAACERSGVPLAAAALQLSLRQPLVTSTIVGITRPERVGETLALASVRIPEELWRQLDELVLPEELSLR